MHKLGPPVGFLQHCLNGVGHWESVTEQVSSQVMRCSSPVEATCPFFYISSLRKGGSKRKKQFTHPPLLWKNCLLWDTGERGNGARTHENQRLSLATPLSLLGMWDNLPAIIFSFNTFIQTQKSKSSFGYIVLTCKFIIKPLQFTGETGRALPPEGLTIFSLSHFYCRAIFMISSSLICFIITQVWNKMDLR